MMDGTALNPAQIFGVAELNAALKKSVEDRFASLTVIGEVSGLRQPSSGHLYFTLKEEQAQIKAVLFRMQRRYLANQPQDGQRVICSGRLSVYEQRGEYQLLIDRLEIHGLGSQALAYEQLKQTLAAEGLFAPEVKKALPRFPQHITLLTSPSGAALHDFLRMAHKRCPQVRISVYPVSVQGPKAAGEMQQALAALNFHQSTGSLETDILVLCRGGGSAEDLAAFNDEQLVREIRRSALPVVSAVGHEVDLTLADLAADLRAPTPSAAAEFVLPDQQGQQDQVHALERRLYQAMQAQLALPQRRLTQVTEQLQYHSPVLRLQRYRQQVNAVQQALVHSQKDLLRHKRQALAQRTEILDSLSPLATLARGYALARKTSGSRRPIVAAAQVQPGESIELILHQGTMHCTVHEVFSGQAKNCT
jgi:exodeoxyribonuclease VII large subunit